MPKIRPSDVGTTTNANNPIRSILGLPTFEPIARGKAWQNHNDNMGRWVVAINRMDYKQLVQFEQNAPDGHLVFKRSIGGRKNKLCTLFYKRLEELKPKGD